MTSPPPPENPRADCLDGVAAETEAWYREYYARHGSDRNDPLLNPGVVFQSLAFDVATTRAIARMNVDRGTAKVLDVGCGSGSSLLNFLKLGFRAENLAGVDISAQRIAAAKALFPSARFTHESAEQLSFSEGAFDIVFESTMFVQLTDETLAKKIADEMLRVTKPGGHVMLIDWRYGKPGNAAYRAMSKSRITSLFDVGGRTRLQATERGALIPPIGRFLSSSAPSMYFLVQAVLPPLVGQTTTVLRKL